MSTKKHQSVLQMIVLIALLTGGTLTFWLAEGRGGLQLVVGVVTSLFYVLWGIMKHREEGDLHTKVVIEYVLVAAIAIVLLVTLAV